MRLVAALLFFSACAATRPLPAPVPFVAPPVPFDLWSCDDAGYCLNQDSTKARLRVPLPRTHGFIALQYAPREI